MGIRKYLATGFTAFDPANPDRKLMDSPCQAAAESVPASSQTTWFRSVHASVQYSTMHLEHQEVCGWLLYLLSLSLSLSSQSHEKDPGSGHNRAPKACQQARKRKIQRYSVSRSPGTGIVVVERVVSCNKC